MLLPVVVWKAVREQEPCSNAVARHDRLHKTQFYKPLEISLCIATVEYHPISRNLDVISFASRQIINSWSLVHCLQLAIITCVGDLCNRNKRFCVRDWISGIIPRNASTAFPQTNFLVTANKPPEDSPKKARGNSLILS